jgi:hypothetical protein
MPGVPFNEKAAERSKESAIRYALEMGKRPKFQDGGPVSGPLLGGHSGGRTDTLPIAVMDGSYVLPADIVSGIPGAEGNSLAGHNLLTKMFNSLPYSPDEAPYGAMMPKIKAGKPKFGMADGGHAYHGGAKGHGNGTVDIIAAPGEHVVPPEIVKRLGKGSLKRGHEILDEFVKEVRKRNIADLKKLPAPVKK